MIISSYIIYRYYASVILCDFSSVKLGFDFVSLRFQVLQEALEKPVDPAQLLAYDATLMCVASQQKLAE